MAQSDKVTEAKTEKYEPRPYKDAKANPRDIAKVENRPSEDQIVDYHRKNPTLKANKAVAEQQNS